MTNHQYNNAVYNAVLAAITQEQAEHLDVDGDTEHTIKFDTGSMMAYWSWSIEEHPYNQGKYILLNEVVVTGDNLDLVVDNFYQYDSMSPVVTRIIEIINWNGVIKDAKENHCLSGQNF